MSTLTPLPTRVRVDLGSIHGTDTAYGLVVDYWRDRLLVVQTVAHGRVIVANDRVSVMSPTCWEDGCDIEVESGEVACWVHLGTCWCDERGGDEHPAHD